MQKLLILGLALFWARPASSAVKVFDFAEEKLNAAPAGFRSTVTGQGSPGEWKIILEDVPSLMPAASPRSPVISQRPVLAQLSRNGNDEHYPLLIYEGETFTDFVLTTRFKPVSGQVEQMAGIAFRIQDENNYYYVRASALGQNVAFFKWHNGRLFGPIGSKMAVTNGVWHELRLECKGTDIRCLLNGKEAFPTLHDQSFPAGKIGFWTKSDSVSYFLDTRVEYMPTEIFAQVLVRDTLRANPRLVGLKVYAPGTNGPMPQLVASTEPRQPGQTGGKAEQDAIARGTIYYVKDKGTVAVILPLHDRNGETVAAVRVGLKPFPGQTEKNAVARALPIVKQMESRVQSLAELMQ